MKPMDSMVSADEWGARGVVGVARGEGTKPAADGVAMSVHVGSATMGGKVRSWLRWMDEGARENETEKRGP